MVNREDQRDRDVNHMKEGVTSQSLEIFSKGVTGADFVTHLKMGYTACPCDL